LTAEQREILRVFAAEAVERIDELEGLLGEIEDAPENRRAIDEFMRAAHTLKGSAGVAGVGDLEALAHVVESVVEHLREGRLSPTPDVFDRLSKALDTSARILPAVRSGKTPEIDLLPMAGSLRGWLDEAVGRMDPLVERRSSQEGFTLGEYDRVRVGVLEEQGKTLFVVQLDPPAGVEETAAWVGSVLRQLRPFGVSVTTAPDSAAREGLEPGQRLSILVGSDRLAVEIEDALATSLGVSATVRPYHERRGDSVGREEVQVSSAVVRERTVRVDLEVLDDLLRLVGELMISRDRYRQVSMQLREGLGDAGLAAEIDDSAEQLGHLTGELQDAIMRARMVPVARVFRAIKRSTRRATRESGNGFHLVTEGDDTELDKNLVDSLAQPLAEFVSQFVRDADGDRSVTVYAARQWNHVVLTVDSTHSATEQQHAALKSAVSRSGGTVDVQEASGGHHAYLVSLPLTLAIIRVMMAAVGNEVYAFPIESIRETLKIRSGDVVYVKGTRATELRGSALSLLFLDELLDVRGQSEGDTKRVLVLGGGERPIGLVVDRLIGIREVVIKPLSHRFSSIRELRGSAILGDDQIALILNAEVMVQQAIERTADLDADTQKLRAKVSQRSTT
jgi:two-component system chemotaxis sensor kinase CheA